MSEEKIIIIGAGLVGSLQALFMRKRGYQVEMYERRPDMRVDSADAGRSINLILTVRGIEALKRVGAHEEALSLTVPVFGRMMHSREGELTYQPYGKDESECNYSVSRAELNKFLMTKAEEAGVKIFFEHKLSSSNFDQNQVSFETPDGVKEVKGTRFLGTDGAGSATRKELMSHLKEKGISQNDQTEMLESEYKELFMPADSSGNYVISKNALHIWPRGSHMFMALPNLEGSFTMTLYLPVGSSPSFSELKTKEDVQKLFEEDYRDSIELMPELYEEFFENPVGRLGTVRCYPWHYSDKVALMGDAAHAIVPFFGQGMNSGFSDCLILDDLLNEHGNWEKALIQYSEKQKADGDAIANMALDNFIEMRDRVGDANFLLKKQVEQILGKEFPETYWSRYRLVIYTTIPYIHAESIGSLQQEILEELCRNLSKAEDVDLKKAKSLIESTLVPYYEEHGLEL